MKNYLIKSFGLILILTISTISLHAESKAESDPCNSGLWRRECVSIDTQYLCLPASKNDFCLDE
jgi:hypothetical protein